MDTNLLWEDNCGSPLHLVLIQESVIHSLDRPHLLWPQRQTCIVPATSKHDNVSELEALPRLNLQGLLTLSLTAPHHTSCHVTAHLTAPHSTYGTYGTLHLPICKMQTVKQTPARHHCLQRMPTGLEVSHTPSSPATQRGCNTCRWCLFTPLSTLMNV